MSCSKKCLKKAGGSILAVLVIDAFCMLIDNPALVTDSTGTSLDLSKLLVATLGAAAVVATFMSLFSKHNQSTAEAGGTYNDDISGADAAYAYRAMTNSNPV